MPSNPDSTPPSDAPVIGASLRVAIIHDWLFGMRGGERTLESLLKLFPNADLYTLFYDPRGMSAEINRRAVHPSPLSKLPGVGRYYRALLPLFPRVMGRLRLPRGYDLAISVSHCVAHGVRPPEGTPHMTYCLSPMRYLYDQNEAYAQGGAGLAARGLGLFAGGLKRWDAEAARRCGHYLAISRYVAARVRRVYDLEAPVVYPPVRTDVFTPASKREFKPYGESGDTEAPYLIVSALAPYKRIDLAIEAANALKKPLVIVGRGPRERVLRAMAGPTVRFLGWVGDAELLDLYRTCAALIFPGEEDFGIAPLEAMACGRPVLALRAGGLMETHREGLTGEFFDANSAESLIEAWGKFDPSAYKPAEIRERAEKFSEAQFLREFGAAAQARLAARE